MCTDNNFLLSVLLSVFMHFRTNYIFYLTPEFGHHSWITKSPVRFDGPPAAAEDLVELKGRTKRPGSNKVLLVLMPPPTCCQGSDSVELKGRTKRRACSPGLHILSHNVLSTSSPKCFRNVLWILMTIGSIIQRSSLWFALSSFFSPLFIKKNFFQTYLFSQHKKHPPSEFNIKNNNKCDIFALKNIYLVKCNIHWYVPSLK